MRIAKKKLIYPSVVIGAVAVLVAVAAFFSIRPAQADPAMYYFANTVNTDPAELGNYWDDAGLTDPADMLPDLSVDFLVIMGGATYDGDATFNGSAENAGIVTGDAIFKDTSVLTGDVMGDATFVGNDSEWMSGTIGGAAIRRYTVTADITRDFTSTSPAWTIVADGAAVTINERSTYDDANIWQRENGGIFYGRVFYFNNASSTDPLDMGNYWTDEAATLSAGRLPIFGVDQITILPRPGTSDRWIYNGDAIFNGAASNQGTVTGDAVFHDYAINLNQSSNGTVVGDAFFYDFSQSQSRVEGDATFYGDFSEQDHDDVVGSITRYYTQDTVTTRSFMPGRGTPWIVVADGAEVDITGSTYDSETVFQTLNGGSFVFPLPELTAASLAGATLTLTYSLPLDETSVPDPADFTVTMNGIEVPALSVAIDGTSVALEIDLERNVSATDTAVIDYTPGTEPLLSETGTSADALADEAVTVVSAIGSVSTQYPFAVWGHKLYAITGGSLSIIDAANQSVISTVSVGTNPSSVTALDGKVFVTNFTTNDVSVVSPLTDTVIATISVGSGPIGATIGGNRLYVFNRTAGTVSIIDTSSLSVVATVAVGGQPSTGAAVGSKLYVANQAGSSVSVIDMLTDTVSATISTASGPRNPLAIGTKLYLLHSTSVTVIDTETDTVSSTISLGTLPERSAAVGTKLYVAESANDRVSVINSETDSVASTIAVGDYPRYILSIGSDIYALNRDSDTVSVIDSASGSVSGTIPVGDGPGIGSAIGDLLYVSNVTANTISVVDTLSPSFRLPNLLSFTSSTPDGTYGAGQSIEIAAHFLRSIEPGSTMTVTLNTGASVVLSTVSGGTISGTYTVSGGEHVPDLAVTSITSASVTDSDANERSSYTVTSSAAEIDADTLFINRNLSDSKNISIGAYGMTAVGQIPRQISQPVTLRGASYLFVANEGSDSVSVIRQSTGAVVETIPVGDRPFGVHAVSGENGQFIYVSNAGSNSISVINPSTSSVVSTISVGERPTYLLSAEGKLYVSNAGSNSVSVINTASNTVASTISVGTEPAGLAVSGSELFVANAGRPNQSGGNSISVIDTDSDTLTDTIMLTGATTEPRGIAVYNNRLYTANYGSDAVSIINTETHAIESEISLPGGPRDIAVAGSHLYVSAFDAGTIWDIDSATRLETAIITVGHSPSGLAVTDSALYYTRAKDGGVSQIALESDTVASSVEEIRVSSRGGGVANTTRPPVPVPPAPVPVPTPSAPATTPGLILNVPLDLPFIDRLRGRLLLAVEDRGRVWYVDTVTGNRYEVTVENALALFRKLSLGIKDIDLFKIPVAPSRSPVTALANRLKGKLLLQVENRGVVWYVDMNGQRHLVERDTILEIFKRLSLGITNKNLEKIPQGRLQ